MTKLTILIVDDERLARDKIVRLLKELQLPVETFTAANGLEAIKMIEQLEPDIIFLDIDIPEMTGFDVLHHFPHRSFKVIFQTAYDEFAINAFQENACDYILKPYTKDRFRQAIERTIQRTSQEKALNNLEEKLRDDHTFLQNLKVKQHDIQRIISVEDIDYFKSLDHYTGLYVGSREYLSRIAIKDLVMKLNPNQFVRIHRSIIVNLKAVTKYSENAVVVRSGSELGFSRRSRKTFLKAMEAFVGQTE